MKQRWHGRNDSSLPDCNPAVSFASLPNHLSDLNREQLEAVQHNVGPLLIFAGAGSGKTRVLTRRIAHLVLEHQVEPSRIFAVTFTNKAANEMKERVQALFTGMRLPSGYGFGRRLWVSTFHSSCARILRSEAKFLEYKDNFAIYDTSDSLSVLKRAYEKLNIDPRFIEPRHVLSRIDRAKNDYKFSDAIRQDRTIPREMADATADLFDAYQAELKASNAMDFGDLLCNVLTLFKLEPRILARYQDQFEYLLVDEYQDTNRVQYELVKLLTGERKNLCVVGDDDQSIYAFRGATVENILTFQKDFPSAKVVTLEINYRSTKKILAAANAVIAKNSFRQKKTMRTDNVEGANVACYHAFDERDEAEFVVREIAALRELGNPYSSMAVFYRTNAQSRAVEELLCEHGVPYQIFGGHRFYDRKEIKDLLAYYRLLLNPDDNEAFLRIINTPARGLGPTSVGGLVAVAAKKRLALLETLRRVLAGDFQGEGKLFLSTANRKKFEKFISTIDELVVDKQTAQDQLRDGSYQGVVAIAGFFKNIAEKTGYLEGLRGENTLESDSRVENIYELFEVAGEFVQRALESGDKVELIDFLERTSLSSDLDKENTKVDAVDAEKKDEKNRHCVSLMTLHLAKGLEFPIVFLVGMEEGVLPHSRSLDTRLELEEERRLCYVGMTRARERLYLSHAEHRQSFGRSGFFSGISSRFLHDIPEELLEVKYSGMIVA